MRSGSWSVAAGSNPNGPKFIDDCSSGGRRIDFETLHRSIPLWPTDFDEAADPEAFQSHQMGLSQMTSVFGAAAHGFDPYSWRSAGMNGKMLWWTSTWDAPRKRHRLRNSARQFKRR